MQNNMIQVYSSNEPIGAKSVIYKEFLITNKVKSRNALSNIGSGFKSMFGGEISGLTKLTSEIRTELLRELLVQAQSVGANCILAVRFETNELFEGMLDIVVYGTAVFCEWA